MHVDKYSTYPCIFLCIFLCIFQNDEIVVDKIHFFTIPSCSIFNVSMYSIVMANESVHLGWTEILQTEVNPEANFTLKNFEILINDENMAKAGESELSKIQWTHSNQCIEKYMVRIQYYNDEQEQVTSELELSSPQHLKQKLGFELSTFPGIKWYKSIYTYVCFYISTVLRNLLFNCLLIIFSGIIPLQNCMKYELVIYPDSFPDNGASYSNWNAGFSTTFAYSTSNNNMPPRRKKSSSVQILKDIQSRSVIIDLEAIASTYTCLPILVEISTQRSIRSNETRSQFLVYNQTYSLHQSQEIMIDQLQPCISHHLKISKVVDDSNDKNKHIAIHHQNFKTSRIFDGMNDTLLGLDKKEVLLLSDYKKNDGDMTDGINNVMLTWADRCADNYEIRLCHAPLGCSHDRFTFFSINMTDKVTRYLANFNLALVENLIA